MKVEPQLAKLTSSLLQLRYGETDPKAGEALLDILNTSFPFLKGKDTVAPGITDTDPREFEQFLRKHGFSRTRAKVIAAKGFHAHDHKGHQEDKADG